MQLQYLTQCNQHKIELLEIYLAASSKNIMLISDNMYKMIGILKVADLYRFSLMKLIYKIFIHGHVPFLFEELSALIPSHDHQTRGRDMLRVPWPTLVNKCNFLYQGVQLWNSLPDDVKHASSLNLAKQRYRDVLLNAYA